MEGFFYSTPEKVTRTKGTTSSIKGPRTPAPERVGCEACGLFKGCISPKMPPSGEGKAKILVVAEAPGRTEDEQGIQLIGQAGQVLRRVMAQVGLDLDSDCRKTNAICCRPPKNRLPKPKEINCCRPRLFKEIEEFKPKLIIILGAVAARSFLGHRWKKDFPKITALRGWVVPDQDVKCWVAYVVHPSSLIRSEDIPTIEQTFVGDLRRAVKHLDKPFTMAGKDNIELMTYPDSIRAVLEGLKKHPPELTAYDYETSGLKLHRKGHFIKSCALSYFRDSDDQAAVSATTLNGYQTFAFPMLPEISGDFRDQFLRNSNINKAAHYARYEESCNGAIFKRRSRGMVWDTCLAAHFLDSRGGVSGLKFQTYVQFGIPDYSSHLDKWIKTEDEDSNAQNKINDAPLDDLLQYNALDALHTAQLAQMQRRIVSIKKNYGYDLLYQGMLALCDVEENGMRIDMPYCERTEKELTRRIEEAETRVLADPEVKKWKVRMDAARKKFNLNSNVQLAKTLYEQMGISCSKQTAKGGNSVDDEALKGIAKEVPFVREMLSIRGWMKARDTYLRNWMRQAVGGVMRPAFSLTTVETFRSSCADPNLQNVPVRNKELQKLLRSAIIPRPDHQLLEIDFKGAEPSIGACYHQDPTMIKYVSNPKKYDIHRDTAMDLFMLTREQVHKDVRQVSKGSFVLPEQYGSYWANTAPDLWNEVLSRKLVVAGGLDNVPLIAHMEDNGIGDYPAFEKHVKRVEDTFWNEKFPVYTAWKKKWYDQYLRKGYLEMLTGFRCQGPLTRNQIINFPIQGTAFHVLLKTLVNLNRRIKREGWDAMIVSQIHDSLLIDLLPEELDQVRAAVGDIIAGLPKIWPWIIIPLTVEMEIAPVGKSWYEKKELK